MNKTEILKHLVRWEEEYKRANKMSDLLRKLFQTGGEIDSVIWSMFDKYTQTLAVLFDDEFDWLPWYCFENDMGKNNMNIYIEGRRSRKKIGNIKQLAAVLEKKGTAK